MLESARRLAFGGVADEVLMERYVGGDATAFDELFRRYEPRAFSYFFRRTGSRDRAQDLYQDLFLRIHRARDAYDSRRPFSPWFFQIAHRLLIDDQRRAYRSQELSLEERQSEAAAVTWDQASAVSERDQLAQLLDGLSTHERHVLVRAKVEGVSYAVIADQLGKSVDAVKQVASRAVRRLRASSAPAPRTLALHGS
jgi:RNA polymerase sigma factor (sigma-70 family)